MLNSTLSELQRRRWQYASIFIRLAVVDLLFPKCAKSREILRKFELTVQGHPRSPILVPIEIIYATSYYSNFGRTGISYRFRHADAFFSKIACFPTPLFDALPR